MKLSELGSLREQLKKFDAKKHFAEQYKVEKEAGIKKIDPTKVTKFNGNITATLDRIKLIEEGRQNEARWLQDINTFVLQMEKWAGIKFVAEEPKIEEASSEKS